MNDYIIQCAAEAEKLCGFIIAETRVDVESGRFGLALVHPDGREMTAWIDADPEGNGPGHLAIEDANRFANEGE